MELNQLSQTLKPFHVPYQTLVFANVWDLASLNIVLGLNSEASKPFKAIATALWVFAAYYRGYGAGFTEDDKQTLIKELDGRVSIRLGQTRAALLVSQLAKLRVARINVGPSLFQVAMNAAKKSDVNVLEGGILEEV
ncbi:carboxyphosphonoenolpyruvate phosphonomutase [Fusarium globosum]|uniref:Carboxyphosphonoenolpyruvate phosphonomutase n=1 Tax=Fusarium globosum TaxID=78864 RepID=A0A8H5Y3N9_9HYPO|nr:carboxyphosphonoenolpyruvate phosphonomutase [Fusarium globosum]